MTSALQVAKACEAAKTATEVRQLSIIEALTRSEALTADPRNFENAWQRLTRTWTHAKKNARDVTPRALS